MTTKLDGSLKRELTIAGSAYTLVISGEGLNLALKGRRKGFNIGWTDLVSGDAALATALNASLTANIQPLKNAPEATKTKGPPAHRKNKAPGKQAR